MNTHATLSDVEILRSSQSRPWLFSLLFDRYQAPFLRKARYILKSQEVAEDAVQETFLKIYKYADRFSEQEGASFQSWAYKVLSNTCYTQLSKKLNDIKHLKMVEFDELDLSSSTDSRVRDEEVSLVSSVLTRLPQRLSRLLFLYFFEDKSYEEIALSEDLSLSAVRSGLHRAKKQFKDLAINLS
jgi:RNA polymerase sigma-70 factor (ECF subfamily)